MRNLLRMAFDGRKHRALLLVAILVMFALTVTTQLEMFILKVLTSKDSIGKLAESSNPIDKVLFSIDSWLHIYDNLGYLALGVGMVALLKGGALFAHQYTTRLVAIRISKDLRHKYFEHLQALPMSFYQQYNIGSLSARVVGDATAISESINLFMINYIQTPFAIVTTFILCFLASWQMSLIVFFGFPMIAFPVLALARRVRRIARKIQKNQEMFSTVLIDFLAGIQTVKMFAMEKFTLQKYQKQNVEMARLEEKSARYDAMARPMTHGIGVLGLASIFFGGLLVLKMEIPQLIFFCGLMTMCYEPIKKFAEQNVMMQRGIAAAERMYEVLSIVPLIEDHPNATKLNDLHESIEFDDVWFKYGEEWVLKGLSFTIKKGETVAIVGPTGAGKSTIVQLLPRLYEVQKGEIRIDGQSVEMYTQNSLRESIAFVPQKPFLFLDTVAENITFGQDFSTEEIHGAAKRAHAHDFINELPNGYQTQLAETGKNLSGGQQQRLAIARALVKKAPILIMDEATSSLDGVSERKIKEAIEELHGDVTQIIIAHRFSTIENADRIIYLESGVKTAEGTRDELLATCRQFRIMWESMHNPEKTNRTGSLQ